MTSGKVLLKTSYGDLEIELWCKEAPKACKNFIQLGIEGFYNETKFHRLLPEHSIQGGCQKSDALVEEGACIYDEGFFSLEPHSRLRFTRRGLVACVPKKENGKLCNDSQFLITLGATPELNGKATIFGRVVGNSLFNVVKMGECDLDGNSDRPIFPPKILAFEVKEHSFGTLEPRVFAKSIVKSEKNQEKNTKKTFLNSNLLSFGTNGDEVCETATVQLSKRSKPIEPLNSVQKESSEVVKEQASQSPKRNIAVEVRGIKTANEENIEEIREKTRRIKEELMKSQSTAVAPAPAKPNKKDLSPLEAERLRYLKRKAPVESEEKILTLMQSFQQKVSAAATPENTPKTVSEERPRCQLHSVKGCESCAKYASSHHVHVAESEDGWIHHRLIFDKNV